MFLILTETISLAWEASCPNEIPSTCSKTKIEGVLAVCECNENKYSLATGQIILDKKPSPKNIFL